MNTLAGLLSKAGIGARVTRGTGPAAAIMRAAGDVAVTPPGVRVWLPDAYGAKAYAAQIMKGAGHKYIKRVPVGTTKSGATRYRYYYEVQHGAGIHNEDHFVEGAAFRHEGGHYHVEKVDGDTLTIKHDETGETRKVSRGALAKMLSEHHSKAIDAHKAKVKADLAATMKHGSAKQQARMKEHAAKWGVVGDDGKGEPGKVALVKVSPDEIPMSVAVAAHSGTSHTPERRGEQEQQGYVEHVEAVEKRIAKMVSGADDEKRKAAADALAEYKAGYRKRLMAYLVARSGLMSTLVTGGSNFPVARMEKRGNTVDKRREELLEWSKKELGRMSREFDPRGPRVVSSDRDDAVEQLSAKVGAAEKRQAMMTEANKVVRSAKLTDEEKIERMVAQGIPKSVAAELLKPDFAGRKGFPAYETSNNAANIKRMKARVEEITAARGQETTEHAFEMPSGETGVVTDNVDENRVEIDFHTGKPTAETIAKLKARGFKWASSKGVWQRQRNNQARYAAGSIVGVDIPTPGAADATPAPAGDVAEMPTPKLADEDAPTGDPGKAEPAGQPYTAMRPWTMSESEYVMRRGGDRAKASAEWRMSAHFAPKDEAHPSVVQSRSTPDMQDRADRLREVMDYAGGLAKPRTRGTAPASAKEIASRLGVAQLGAIAGYGEAIPAPTGALSEMWPELVKEAKAEHARRGLGTAYPPFAGTGSDAHRAADDGAREAGRAGRIAAMAEREKMATQPQSSRQDPKVDAPRPATKTHPAGTHEAGHQKVARELSDAVKRSAHTPTPGDMLDERNKAFAAVASGEKTVADLDAEIAAAGISQDKARGLRAASQKISATWGATDEAQMLKVTQRRKDVNEAHSAKVDPHVADKAALDGWQKNDAGAIDHVHKRAQELLPGVRMQDSHDVVSQHVYGGGVTDAYRDRMARENRIQVKPAAGASTMPEGTRVALHPVGTDYMRGEKGTVMGDSPHLAGHVVVNFDNGKSLAVRAKDVKSTGEPPRPNGANDNDAAAQAVPSADPKAKAANPGQARDIDTLRALAGVDVPRGTALPPIKQDALESMSYRELRDLQDHVRGMAKRMTPQVAWGTPSAAQIEASARVDAFNTEHKPLNDSVSAATEAIGVAIRAAIAREASPPPNPKLGAKDGPVPPAAKDLDRYTGMTDRERWDAWSEDHAAGRSPMKPEDRSREFHRARLTAQGVAPERIDAGADLAAYSDATNASKRAYAKRAADEKAQSMASTPGHHVKSGDRMSNSGYHRSGKPNWWLRRTDQGGGNFIDIPRVRGDEKLDIKLDLEPGTYTAGAGKGKDGVRHSFTVPEKVQKSHGLAALLRTALGHV